jgi:two-component system, LuxR family, response regulator FixJ
MNPSGTVFLVEDDVDVRQSATWALERHGVAVEAFASAEEILMSLNPDALGCYVLDLRLPEMNGLELRRRLVENGCRQPFIILSGEGDVALAVEAMRLGAVDFIEKPVEPSKLLDAVRKCIEFDAVERRRRAAQQQLERRLNTLSPREREVFDLVVQGQTSKQIGMALTISPKTVEVHRSRIVKKLGFESAAQLVIAMAEQRRGARP